jgi:adenylyltransferase/sulfurtransferase
MFSKPPPPESVVSCGDGGILGPVVGTMGVLQALEAIKVLTRDTKPSSPDDADPATWLLFSAYASSMFRTLKLRSRKPRCAACSAQATVTPEALNSGSLDYVQFCGTLNPVNALSANERISVDNYAKIRMEVNPFTGMEPSKDSHILVDTREKVQFDLCNIEGSINIPFSTVSSTSEPTADRTSNNSQRANESGWVADLRSHPDKPIFVVCRLGNDSQLTVKKMKALGLDNGGQRWIGDLRGGLRAWRESVDNEFPDY